MKFKTFYESGKETIYPLFHVSNEQFDSFDRSMGTQGITWFSRKPIHDLEDIGAQLRPGQPVYLYTCSASIGNPAGRKEYENLGLGEIEQAGYDAIILGDILAIFNDDDITIHDVEEIESDYEI